MKDLPSPSFDDRRGIAPGYIILHYTGMKTAEEALERLVDPDSKVSAHYTVDEDATIYRHVDESARAWHAGQSFWAGQRDMNAASVGIELVNPGHAHGYRPFPETQISSLINLCRDIMQRHDIPPENVLAHSDVAPARKEDPGELFPWRALAAQGVGIWPEPSDEDAVRGAGLQLGRAFQDLGYDPAAPVEKTLRAFQRHFVPEAFGEDDAQERAEGLTRTRLYALLAGHLRDSR